MISTLNFCVIPLVFRTDESQALITLKQSSSQSSTNRSLQSFNSPNRYDGKLFCCFIPTTVSVLMKSCRVTASCVVLVFKTRLFSRVQILLCCGGSCSPSDALSSHCYHLLFAFLTCFLFTAHLPERLAPGRFDYFGMLLFDVEIGLVCLVLHSACC